MEQNTSNTITRNFVPSLKALLFASAFFFGFGTQPLFAQEKLLSEAPVLKEEVTRDTFLAEEILSPAKEELLASEEPIKEEPVKLTQEQIDALNQPMEE